jgi:hypothetical protein
MSLERIAQLEGIAAKYLKEHDHILCTIGNDVWNKVVD